ncbi:sulfite exporter TauE/SafE family protein [Aurantibacter crassamenti]|uniref:sulfite exporter TauE/SafE family protein n=1 Tax=Aurantibacter crassamenti TaxID=1837375 RepID=UPI00193A2F8E|nr:sulfite exporter TauE/SafE family protein [Aurantibacter crassamenti]MBM1106563.1 sulfite exporter TauE/SafE family protein [Aurantibacter crassamenti]
MLSRYLPVFIILSIVAEVLGTVGGFGSSVFFVPMASYFMDFQSVLGITALFHLSSNITKIGFFRKGFDKTLMLYLGIPAVLFVSLGAYLSKYANPKWLTLILGIFLIAFGLLFIIHKTLKVEATKKNAIIGGSLSGLFAGLLGTGGAIRGATMTAFNLNKEKFIATSAIIDLGIDLSRSIIYINNGYVHRHDLCLIPILIVVSIVGTYFGKLILDRITQEQFKHFVLYLLVGIGILTVVFNLK